MKFQLSPSDPTFGFDADGLLRELAQQCKTRGITTDAQFSAAIDAMTAAQLDTLCKAIIKKLILIV